MDAERRVELFDAMFEIAQSLDAGANLEEVTAAAERLIRDHSGGLPVRIILARPDSLGVDRLPSNSVEAPLRSDLEAVWRSGEPVARTDGTDLLPLRRGGHRIGVLIAGSGASPEQMTGTAGARPEDQSVRRTLRSVAAQVSLLLENAILLADRTDSVWPSHSDDVVTLDPGGGLEIHGERASPGSVGGFALPWEASFDQRLSELERLRRTDRASVDDPNELRREFDRALEHAVGQLERIRQRTADTIDPTVATIFDAHILMLRSGSFSGRIRDLIGSGTPVGEAIRVVVTAAAERLESMPDSRLAEKAQDVRDIGMRLLRALSVADSEDDYQERIVLAASMVPSELLSLAAQGIAGIVFLGAGLTAHLSILARSLGVPALITQDRRMLQIVDGTPLLLDADAGRLVVKPAGDATSARDSAAPRRAAGDGTRPRAEVAAAIRARIPDAVSVRANVNIATDATRARAVDADGIGLYRSEFPFIIRSDLLSEDEQVRIYSGIASSVGSRPLVMRTADIGGDKLLPVSDSAESNPFLGVRGIRFSLANREFFRDQLRAMARAGAGSDLRIMFPMVSSIEEISEARAEVERCIAELADEGFAHNASPRLGAMIELPSAVEILPELASELDFLSIGTNDLVMYLLAVDRTNGHLSELYRSYHPTVLRTLSRIGSVVGQHDGCELGVCGDVAGDPVMAAFMLGTGVTSFSVAPDMVWPVRCALAAMGPDWPGEVVEQLLAARRVAEIDRRVVELRAAIETRMRDLRADVGWSDESVGSPAVVEVAGRVGPR